MNVSRLRQAPGTQVAADDAGRQSRGELVELAQCLPLAPSARRDRLVVERRCQRVMAGPGAVGPAHAEGEKRARERRRVEAGAVEIERQPAILPRPQVTEIAA